MYTVLVLHLKADIHRKKYRPRRQLVGDGVRDWHWAGLWLETNGIGHASLVNGWRKYANLRGISGDRRARGYARCRCGELHIDVHFTSGPVILPNDS